MAKVTANIQTERYRIEIKTPTSNHLVADEPIDKGGKDTGFSPKELLVAALSACTAATLRMYIERKGWDIPEISIQTELTESNGTSTFARKIRFAGKVADEQKSVLLKVANTCPVHKVLAGDKVFLTDFD
jgi:putative redox protein